MVNLEILWLLFLTLPDIVKGVVLVAFVLAVILILRATPLWKSEPWSHPTREHTSYHDWK